MCRPAPKPGGPGLLLTGRVTAGSDDGEPRTGCAALPSLQPMILAVLLPAIGARALLARRTPLLCAVPRATVACMATQPSPQLAALATIYYSDVNARAFSNALPEDMVVRWNPRLRRSAGRCLFYVGPRTEIELSPHVLDSAERLKTTLAHEMCHAAQWLVDGEARPPHGSAFQHWARQVECHTPEYGPITTTHTYAVRTRYSYKCTQCGQKYGRHSRLDLRARCCGKCRGRLALDSEAAHGLLTGASTRPMPAFAAFVSKEYAAQRRRWPHVPHQRIMVALGRKWRRKRKPKQ